MVDFAGWEMPVQYGSIVAEHHAVRSAAGLFDVCHMGEIEISGREAEACCARLFTNDARTLRPGQAHYSLLANENGGLVDDVIIYRLEAERFLVCVNAANVAKDFAWMKSHSAGFSAGGCVLRDLSDEFGLIALQGPRATEVAGRLDPGLVAAGRFSMRRSRLAGVEVWAARTGYTGEDGFEFFVAPRDAVALWRALLEAGSDLSLAPAGLGARDTLRLEAALPLYGHELGEDISPFEARVGWAVKLNRPDMVGYAALAAAKREGVARRLVGLEVLRGVARHGYPLFASPDASEPLGYVSSGSHCPTAGKALALALVAAGAAAGLDRALVDIRGKRRPVRVTGLPFYVRQA